jgi:hypothetical protein
MILQKEHPRFKNYICHRNGMIFSKASNRFLTPKPQKNGYFCLSIGPSGKQKRITFHRFIMEAFRGPSDLHVNHIDGNKQNNHLDNLEYVTHKENMVHAGKTGLMNTSRGEKAGNAKLKEHQVLAIITLLNTGRAQEAIAKDFGVTCPTIWAIAHNKSWKHLGHLKCAPPAREMIRGQDGKFTSSFAVTQ